jgi:hypothetical protein
MHLEVAQDVLAERGIERHQVLDDAVELVDVVIPNRLAEAGVGLNHKRELPQYVQTSSRLLRVSREHLHNLVPVKVDRM